MNRALAWLAVGAGVAGLAAGCSSSARTTAPTTTLPTAASPSVPRGSGPVNVLYAGSLVNLMERQIGPGFKTATGYTLDGFSAGSSAIATEIKGKVHRGDVFVSASPSVNDSLEGTANGNWVSWYVTFARSPLVLGYNPSSKFAADLRTRPWYQVLTEPGILVGRTDPATDPKGKLTASALTSAARQYNVPPLANLARSTSDVYPEETLVGRLQAGQLDVGFFYSSEATAASLPSVPVTIPGQKLQATYTATVLAGAPNRSGAEAFVAYLLGPQGQAALTRDGFQLVLPPTLTGRGVPAGLQGVIPGS